MSIQVSFHGVALPSLAPASSSLHSSRRLLVRAKAEPSDKSVEVMRKFSEQYARRSGTYFCVDKGVTAVVIKGLADHRDTLGAPLCPYIMMTKPRSSTRILELPMRTHERERKECHCMLFLTPDNDFAGAEQVISIEEIKETTSKI